MKAMKCDGVPVTPALLKFVGEYLVSADSFIGKGPRKRKSHRRRRARAGPPCRPHEVGASRALLR